MFFFWYYYIFYNRNAISEENEAANFSEKSFSKVLFDSNDNYNGNVGKISMEDAKEGITNMATVTKEVIIQMIRYFFAHYNQNDISNHYMIYLFIYIVSNILRSLHYI